MGMNVGNTEGYGEPDVLVDINTTPLIDVMLVLLMMLILTIPVQTHAVKMNMPVGNPPPPTVPPEVVRIDVAPDGAITWNGQVVPDRTSLEDRFRSIGSLAPQPEVHLRPDRNARYEHVALVMASAQRLRVIRIGLVGNERFLDF